MNKTPKERYKQKSSMEMTTDVVSKYWARKQVNFILSERLCFNHMKEFILENKLKDEDADSVQLLGICHKCGRGGIVYYLEWKSTPPQPHTEEER